MRYRFTMDFNVDQLSWEEKFDLLQHLRRELNLFLDFRPTSSTGLPDDYVAVDYTEPWWKHRPIVPRSGDFLNRPRRFRDWSELS